MSFELTREEGVFLVKLARKAVEEYLKTGSTMKAPEDTPPKLMERCGVFVTLNSLRHGRRELRGCIGFPYPTTPLVQAVIESAINSATQDPRFYPVSLDELDHIVFEVSVLTPPQLIEVEKPMDYPSKIKVGQDGLIVERGHYKGLLLPQVPIEWNWEEEEFLCQCCIKAGFSPDSWLLKGTKIYKFQAIIFEEKSPKGEIEQKELYGK
ncbi:MAG: TIGR00296 family protein [Candidatus Bathyarchaeia archaeon]